MFEIHSNDVCSTFTLLARACACASVAVVSSFWTVFKLTRKNSFRDLLNKLKGCLKKRGEKFTKKNRDGSFTKHAFDVFVSFKSNEPEFGFLTRFVLTGD